MRLRLRRMRLCLRLRRWRPLTSVSREDHVQNPRPSDPARSFSLPSSELAILQARWLAPARARVLRRAHIARRARVLDLAAGRGAVTHDLLRRSEGAVVALDRSLDALRSQNADAPAPPARRARLVCADATNLPFLDASFDLVFSQCAFMWMDAPAALDEVRRVLSDDGLLVAFEPDYGGMIEFPQSLASRDLWISALSRAGADPLIGRKLPAMLAARGFFVRTDLIPELAPPAPERFAFLRDLPLTDEEQQTLQRIEKADSMIPDDLSKLAHLPFFIVTANRNAPSR